MNVGRIISRLAMIAGLCLLLALPSFSQQWPAYGQNQYGVNGGYSSRMTQQPMVNFASPSSAVLTWSTDSNFNTFMRIGTDPNNLNRVVRSSGKGNPHYARLQGELQPGQTYFFQIFDPSNNALTPVMAFETPTQGVIRDQPAQLATNMAANGYGRRDRDWRDRDQNRDRDRDYDRDRDRDQSAYGRERLPQGDYGYGRAYGQDQTTQDVRIIGEPRVRFNGNGSAVVTWTTNVPASAVVHYGTDPNNLTQTAEAPWGGTTHSVTVNNLSPGTDYFFQVQSGQAQGTGSGITSPVVRFRAR